MSNKKHVHELDELDSIAGELASLDVMPEQKKTRLRIIANNIRGCSDKIHEFYLKVLRSNTPV